MYRPFLPALCLAICLCAALTGGCWHNSDLTPAEHDNNDQTAMSEKADKPGISARTPTRVPATGNAPAAGINPSVPQALLVAMRTDLAQREALDASAIEVKSAQPVTWRDGAMGCPEKGMAYTQALIPGYRVLLRSGGTDFAYHAGRDGRFRLCEKPTSEGIAPPGAGGEEVQ